MPMSFGGPYEKPTNPKFSRPVCWRRGLSGGGAEGAHARTGRERSAPRRGDRRLPSRGCGTRTQSRSGSRRTCRSRFKRRRSFKDRRNKLYVVLVGKALTQVHQLGINDPVKHFHGRTIEASGKVRYITLPQITQDGRREKPRRHLHALRDGHERRPRPIPCRFPSE